MVPRRQPPHAAVRTPTAAAFAVAAALAVSAISTAALGPMIEFDGGSDGEIDRTEWLEVFRRLPAGRQQSGIGASHPTLALTVDQGGSARVLRLWDRDGDGVVSEREWLAAHDLMDFNHDTVVTEDEFVAETARASDQAAVQKAQ